MIVLVLAVEGYFLRTTGGCQTPCLVISACAVAETALASTPPSSSAICALPSGARPSGFAPDHVSGAAAVPKPAVKHGYRASHDHTVQAVSPMNRLALCARDSRRNVLSEARDLRHSLRESMDHVSVVGSSGQKVSQAGAGGIHLASSTQKRRRRRRRTLASSPEPQNYSEKPVEPLLPVR